MQRVRFGAFAADLASRELFCNGERVRLPNQSFVVLAVLLSRAGQLVTRDELRQQVWPDNRVVEFEQGLNAVVNRLREALGDSAETPKYIETLPRRGYRFIGLLETVAPNARIESSGVAASETGCDNAASPTVDPAPTRQSRRSLLMASLVVLSAAIVGTAALFIYRGRAAVGNEHAPPVPFTSLVGQEVAPSFSPDGSQIVFAWNGEADHANLFDLYIKGIDSERALRVTHHPADALSAAWAPDGAKIAFARTARGASGIFMVPAPGGAERRLVDAQFGDPAFMQLSWSPDARQLAYAALDGEGSYTIRLLQLDTLESKPLRTGGDCRDAALPTFSRDGRQLAFVCSSSVAVYSVYVTDPSSQPPRLLASMLGNPRGLRWSFDGERLLLVNEAGEGGALWEISSSGRVARLPFGEDAMGPGIAVQGDRIAYVQGKEVVDIWRVDLSAAATAPDKSGTRLIYSTRSQLMPQYSPDGSRIAFQSNRSGSPEIWLADADGSNALRLTSFNGALTGAPAWCSDGRRIAFDSRASGTSAIYVMEIDKPVPHRVQASRENLALPVWSEDCQWIFASDGRRSLYRFPSNGGRAESVTSQHSYYASVSGARVIFNAEEPGGVVLWSKPVAGGDEAPLPGMPLLTYSDSWTTTRDGVYFTRAVEESATLNFYDFASQQAHQVMQLQQAPTALGGLGLSVSPDGRSLLYTRSGASQADIMLVRAARPKPGGRLQADD